MAAIDPLRASPVDLIASFGLMLDRSRETRYDHAWRVALLGYHLAKRLDSFEAPLVFLAGMVMDCGAIHFRRHIVEELADHPSTLSQKADTQLFFHPVTANEALRRLPGMRRVAELVLSHHECLNGSGYPAGLVGDQIELGAQILRVADQLDLVLRSDQPGNEKEAERALAPYEGEDFSAALVRTLREILSEHVPFGYLLRPEAISEEVEKICRELAGIRIFEDLDDWERVLAGLANIVDSHNLSYSQGHSTRSAELADRVATMLDLSEEDRRLVRWAGYLQNMGETALQREFKGKSGRLDETEREAIRRHPLVGEELLGRVEGFAPVARIVRCHHENWDGSGYPEGLAMTDIPLHSRIIRVADTFDAMISDRPYKRRRDWRHSLKELRRHAGSQFDPHVVEAAVTLLSAKT
ncbi:MAG: HD domain-containing protein [Myxococcales bacterium]|nr:MAG: HD domain-containing protein [Myxococcales bacterium]